MTVLYDPRGRVQTAFDLPSPNDWHVVLSEGSRIEHVGRVTADEAAATLDALLSSPE
jgi:hypothetical protein